MKIWVDADACPKPIKEILFRAAKRLKTTVTLVANKRLRIPDSSHIETIQVPGGFDVADDYIVEHLKEGDLAITADIPLAAKAIEKGGYALNPNGEFYSEANVKERLAIRNFMDELRSSGVDTGGPAAFSHKDRLAFANQLDRFLTNHL